MYTYTKETQIILLMKKKIYISLILLFLCAITSFSIINHKNHEEDNYTPMGYPNNEDIVMVNHDDEYYAKQENDTIRKDFYNKLANGDLDAIKSLVDNKIIDIKQLTENNNSPYWLMATAALSENEALVDYFIEKGVDVKLADEAGETALHWTAWQGSLKGSKLLIDRGANINAYYRANGGLTPLICAIESGNLELVKYLIDKGANEIVDTQDGYSNSAIRVACLRGNYDMFKYFEDRKSSTYDYQNDLFFAAIWGNNIDIVKHIVETYKIDVNKPSKYGEKAIEEAAGLKFPNYGDGKETVEIIKYLLSKGAKLKDINKGKIFPWAMNESQEEVIAFFIEEGVTPKEEDLSRDWTPLTAALDRDNTTLAHHYLEKEKNGDPYFRGLPLVVFFSDGQYNSSSIIKLLIEYNINQKHYSEAFLQSIMHNDLASAQLLLDAGANINITDREGRNALYYISNKEVGKHLIEKGIDLKNQATLRGAGNNFVLLSLLEDLHIDVQLADSIKNNNLLKAALLGDSLMVDYFLRKGADVNTETKYPKEIKQRYYGEDYINGQTPLIYNAKQGYSHCSYGDNIEINPASIKLLIKAKANIDHQDSLGNTALHYASGSQWCRIGIGPIPMGGRMDQEAGAHGDPAMPPLQKHDLIVSELIKAKAQLNIQNNEGDTPLLTAAKNENNGAIKLLIKAGADQNIKNKKGETFLDYIRTVDNLITLKDAKLLDKISKKQLNKILADTYNDTYNKNLLENIKLLLDYGADIETKVENFYGRNMLLETASSDRYNKLQLIQLLLENKANVNAQDKYGNTALILAIDNFDEKYSGIICQLLIDKGANVNMQNNNHTSPYTIANYNDYKDRFNVNKQNYNHRYPYNIDNYKVLLDLLTNSGAKRDKINEWWYAVKEDFPEDELTYLKKLKAEGMDINMKTTYSMDPESSHRLLGNGMTALMYYSSLPKPNHVKTLIDWGADVNIKDNDGKTALDYAKEEKLTENIKILKAAGAE